MKCDISIIVPVYNVEKYIEKSIESICNQNNTNYEIIIINDGTEDNSINIALSVLNKYKVPYSIVNQENAGLPAARNVGIKKAGGKYICFIDSDDILDHKFINMQFKFLCNNNLDASFCDFEETTISERGGKKFYNNGSTIISTEKLLYNFLTRKYKIHCCSIVFKKEFLINNELFFDERLRFGEDVEFMWRVFPCLTSIGYIKEPLYKYLVRDNSLMTTPKIEIISLLHQVLAETIKCDLNYYPQYSEILKLVPERVRFASIHMLAMNSKDFNTFYKGICELKFKSEIFKFYKFPDYRVKILTIILQYTPKLFFYMFNRNVRRIIQ